MEQYRKIKNIKIPIEMIKKIMLDINKIGYEQTSEKWGIKLKTLNLLCQNKKTKKTEEEIIVRNTMSEEERKKWINEMILKEEENFKIYGTYQFPIKSKHNKNNKDIPEIQNITHDIEEDYLDRTF